MAARSRGTTLLPEKIDDMASSASDARAIHHPPRSGRHGPSACRAAAEAKTRSRVRPGRAASRDTEYHARRRRHPGCPGRRKFRELGKRSRPASAGPRTGDQIEPGRYGSRSRSMPIHEVSGDVEEWPGVAACPKRVGVRHRRRSRRGSSIWIRLARDGNVRAAGGFMRRLRARPVSVAESDAKGPIAPQIYALGLAWGREKRLSGKDQLLVKKANFSQNGDDRRATPIAPPVSHGIAGLPWDSSVKDDLGVQPKNGSALHPTQEVSCR